MSTEEQKKDMQAETSEKQNKTDARREKFARKRGGRNRKQRPERDSEFDSRTIEIARVTRVMAGGKRMRFRALVVIGDRKGKVGYGVAKGSDVSMAVQKATNAAKKDMQKVKLKKNTIPHEMKSKSKSALLMMRPAVEGTGVIAGGAMRSVFELAGVQDIVSKSYGSGNKLNIVRATVEALRAMK